MRKLGTSIGVRIPCENVRGRGAGCALSVVDVARHGPAAEPQKVCFKAIAVLDDEDARVAVRQLLLQRTDRRFGDGGHRRDG